MKGKKIIAGLKNVSLSYKGVKALDGVSIDIPQGQMVAVVGPDGVGKSSLLALMAGARKIQHGQVIVFGDSMARKSHRRLIYPNISYMPQGLGKNLYPSLSVFENVDFFARLFGQSKEERQIRIRTLLEATGLGDFSDRPVGQLSGGMKQKLGLCCSLIHDPDLLILDEPTTGIDPLSKRQFWSVVLKLRKRRPNMSVVVATAYMEEASSFDWIVMMNAGKILYEGAPRDLLSETSSATLEEGYIKLLPPEQKLNYHPIVANRSRLHSGEEIVIEARELTKSFDDFIAVERVNFRIARGEIYGFLGSNGCGKTTTMKMLTGLLPSTSGEAFLFGHPIGESSTETSLKVGFMTQSFSLYRELTVGQNLILHGRLFSLKEEDILKRVEELAVKFDLVKEMDKVPLDLPLGVRQRLSLATALIHRPEILILDEPTSGVDPVARDSFWHYMIELSEKNKVTIFISTHFMNEAERCDRIALMHAGRVLETGTPKEITDKNNCSTLEDAFISVLEKAGAGKESISATTEIPESGFREPSYERMEAKRFSFQRLWSYSYRESLELFREPVRLLLAMAGSVILLVVMCYGISFEVEDIAFAVWDQDQSPVSRDYIQAISASPYFTLKTYPDMNQEALDQMMRRGEIALSLQIPSGLERDLANGSPVRIGAWVDAAMPMRGETILGYVQGMHAHWVEAQAKKSQMSNSHLSAVKIDIRYRYNPDVKSMIAIVPTMIPILLLFIPAMLAALAVVREKELGSITNFYVTPVTKVEFILGKQLPYMILAIMNFLFQVLIAVYFFDVPMKGSFIVLLSAAVLYVGFATSFGFLMSTFSKSQVAALISTSILSILPAVQFSGMVEPVSSMEGIGRFIGRIYPTTHFLTISQGVFSKAISFSNLYLEFVSLLLAALLTFWLGVFLLNKQER